MKVSISQTSEAIVEWCLQWVEGKKSPRETYAKRLLVELWHSPAIYPRARMWPWLAGDMKALTLEAESFDGVVSSYTLFYFPRSKLKALLDKADNWLKPGWVSVLNLATIDDEEIHGEFLGYDMFWSSHDVYGNQALLKEVGSDLLQVENIEGR
ncbi:hypothetical protein LY76DRAFT_614796 [Colletotrichum caudatum]|nr:hypothetical protein LY76DRAFT_614796 [Colletotrichum caudatum]